MARWRHWVTCRRFQHTATRRWLHPHRYTHFLNSLCFNTQPPEGGCWFTIAKGRESNKVSTHSHPKVAAPNIHIDPVTLFVSTHSHPKVAASYAFLLLPGIYMFQHTATRRWLRIRFTQTINHTLSFNTQPPEGGCDGSERQFCR